MRNLIKKEITISARWAGFSVALALAGTLPGVAWADTAIANAGASGQANSGGKISSGAGIAATSVANTAASNQAATSNSKADFAGGAAGSGKHTAAVVVIGANAAAGASSSGNTLKAVATAGTDGNGVASGKGAMVSASVGNGVKAVAISNPNQSIATAQSNSGGYAVAVTGLNGYTMAYVPGGTGKTYNEGGGVYTIAYNKDGTYSLAITKGSMARALTGASSLSAALASGNLRVLLGSASFAEAYADQNQAWASASATIDGKSRSGQSFAVAYGGAYAFASVSRGSYSQTGIGGNVWTSSSNGSNRSTVTFCVSGSSKIGAHHHLHFSCNATRTVFVKTIVVHHHRIAVATAQHDTRHHHNLKKVGLFAALAHLFSRAS